MEDLSSGGLTKRASQKPLRVVSIAHSAFPDGSGRLRYTPFAGDRSVELTVVIPDHWSESGRRFERGTSPIGVELRVMKAYLPSVPKMNWYLHFYPGMRRLLDEIRPDVLHLWEEPWSIVATQAAFLCQSLRIPLVLETDQNVLRSLPFPFQQLRSYTLRRTDLLIARQEEALHVSRAWGYKGPAAFVEYVVDQSCFRPMDRGAARNSFNVDGFTVGYVGRLIREKGLFTVLDAIKACKHRVNFLMMGSGGASSELHERIQELGLGERVRVLGPQPQSRVAEFMNSLDALVLMSETTRTWKEQFGRVIIEAQSCGVPVIGSSSGSIPGVIGQGGWIVEEGKSLQLTALLNDLADNSSKLAEASISALNNLKRFSPEIVSGSLRNAWFRAAESKAECAR